MTQPIQWITDRQPTAADGDDDGDVRLKGIGYRYTHWSNVDIGEAWRHDDGWIPSGSILPYPLQPPAPSKPRQFLSISRTIDANGNHWLDAIDEDGAAWWSVNDGSGWRRSIPLPTREEQP